MRVSRPRLRLVVALLAPLAGAFAQPAPELKQILERLDRLEAENRTLRDEVRQLRDQVGGEGPAPAEPIEKSDPMLEERVGIQERRTAELAQSKIEASQRFPIRITGMALINAFSNSKQNGGSDNPTIASVSSGAASGGATWRQSIIGLDYRGSQTLWNGKVHGSLFLDFFGGTNTPLNNLLRIRTASFGIDWSTRSLTIAQDKALVSSREPDSLSQVGVSPLTGAGNLWLWEPQVRFEQRLRLDEQTALTAQVALVQTTENASAVPPAFAPTLERFRPGLEGRFQFSRGFSADRRIEIAPGFHTSTTHVAASSVPSSVFFVDWFLTPARPIELSGTYFSGENIAHFGIGGIRQGFYVLAPGNVQSVHSQGGWAQLTLIATPRLSFHLMAGQHDDRNADVRAGFGGATGGGIGKNEAFGGNFFYKLAPNVIASFEALQSRTTYLGPGNRLNNHYDLGVAYLF